MGLFEGKIVLVSGGTRGIGFAAAKKFAHEGATVAVCGRNRQHVDQAAADLRMISASSTGMKCDVSNPEEIDAMFTQLVDQYKRLDICLVTAGICEWRETDEISVNDFNRTMDINARGLFLVTRHAGKMMKKQGSGSIILNGSISGFMADPQGGLIAYEASKGAVHLLTKSFAAEYGPFGVRVNGIAPGWISTDMNAQVRADADMMKEILNLIPLGRFGEPEEVAELAAFLASEDASFVNGAIVSIDGGNLSI
ncbi:MAG: SDR family oxidoreductase [Deltaproteobacteria bacterium]|nr:SDR family oxidoreductase [Deltaproteobacteria bacterium]